MKNKNKQSGFIDLILIIVAGLIAMRFYGVTFSDLTDWLKNLNADKMIGWFKDLMDWIKALLASVGGPSL
jgi:NhaP-type Na+/H+ or K+/H+ antiporter